MASSSRQVLLLAVAATAVACLASLASATQFVVGDDLGWTAQFNQTGWADGKTFVVGDSLQFVYPLEEHNVIMVGEGAFAACDLSADLQLGNWTSGNDVVQLDTQGRVWFICNKADHCLNGMKLVIDVVDGTTTPPAAAPLPSPFPVVPAPAGAAPSPLPLPGIPAPAPPSTVPGLPSPPWEPAPAAPPSAAVRNPVGCVVAVVAAAVVAAALAF